MRTLYDLLEVGADADDEALNRAYRKAAKAHHPDLNAGDPDAARRFKQIAAAIEILRDAGRRAAYDRWLDGKRQQQVEQERQRRRLRRRRIIVANAIAASVLIAALVGRYVLIGPTFSTSAMVSKVENSAARGVVATAAEQRTQRTEPTGGEELRGRPEQRLAAIAVSKQSAASEREAALRREQDERRQAAEFERQASEREAALRREQEERRQAAERERQASEREAALRREQDERRQAAERERQMAEREAALRREQDERRQAAEFERQASEREAALRREQDQRRQAAERERQKAEREAALREEHKAKHLAAIPEAARSAAPTPSQAVQGDQAASSAASSRSFGPAEIAATRAVTRF